MPRREETESAVADWLNDPAVQREIRIVRRRFPAWRGAAPYLFTLMMEILQAMDFYGGSIEEVLDGPTVLPDEEDDEEGDEWKKT